MTQETKTLKLNLDYKLTSDEIKEEIVKEDGTKEIITRKATEDEIAKGFADVSIEYINFAVSAMYKTGLTSQFRRIFSGIQNKIDKALEDKTYSIALQTSEISFIKDAFLNEDVKFPAKTAQYVVVLEDAILGL